MTRHLAAAALILAEAISPAPALASDTLSGNYIIDGCRILASLAFQNASWQESVHAGECAGAIKALVYVSQVLPESAKFCSPNAVTWAQYGAVAVNYIDRNPADRHLPFTLLLGRAFQQAWPCPRS